MKVSVWDTYVTRKDGKVMHFDILVPEEMKDAEKVYDYGKQYLSGKPVLSESLSAKECTFCHVVNNPIRTRYSKRKYNL